MSLFNAMMDRCDDLVAESGKRTKPISEQVIRDFVSRLRGLDKVFYYDDALDLFPELVVPDGLFHARFTGYEVLSRSESGALNLSEPYELGGCIMDDCVPLPLRDVLSAGLLYAGMDDATSMGPGLWFESFALPIVDPGVLEIAMVLEPFERNDGSETARRRAKKRYLNHYMSKKF